MNDSSDIVKKSVFNIAHTLLNRPSQSDIDLLKLIKLCYLCYGWHLAFHKEDLFYEKIQAWRYGPVIPELYFSLKHFKGGVLPKNCVSSLIQSQTELTQDAKETVEEVYKAYGELNGMQLSTLTHKRNTPWHKTYNGQPNTVISSASIRKHFEFLLENGRAE